MSLAITKATIPPEPGTVAKMVADLAPTETEAMEAQLCTVDDT